MNAQFAVLAISITSAIITFILWKVASGNYEEALRSIDKLEKEKSQLGRENMKVTNKLRRIKDIVDA